MTTVGGAGEGEAFRGGVCARGEGVWGTGRGLSVLACLSVFRDSFSDGAAETGECDEELPLSLASLSLSFLSPLLSFLCRLSYNTQSRVSHTIQLQTPTSPPRNTMGRRGDW